MPLPKPTWHPWIPSDHFAPGGLADGLMAAWFALEGAGGKLHDLSRFGNNGTLQAGATWAAGRDGPVLTLDGDGDYVAVAHNPVITFDTTDPLSFVALVRTPNADAHMALLDKSRTSSPFEGYIFRVGVGGDDFFQFDIITGPASNERIQVEGSTTVNDGVWHQMAVSYNGSGDASGVQIYIDGRPDAMTVNVDTATDSSSAAAVPLAIGARSDGSSLEWDGDIDSILIYNRALPAPDIRTLHADPYALLRPVRRWWAVALEVEAAGITHPVIGSDVVGSPVIRSNIT